MAQMFDGCKSLKELPDISKWGTVCVKDMSYMLHNCWALTSFPDISKWKLFNVKNMSHMFHNCWALTSFPNISNWDISNVQDMSFMFHNFPLSLIFFNWNISQYQNTYHMFTNFYNYHNFLLGNKIINVTINLNTGFKSIVHAYSGMLIMDVIDIFYKKNTNLDYPFDIIFMLDTNYIKRYFTLSQYITTDHIEIIGYN